jgi:hypothetical protein
MTHEGMWIWRDDRLSSGKVDLEGYAVEGADGEIGSVDEAAYEEGASYVVVETGPWIFGRKVLLPAGVIEHIDSDAQRLQVGLSKAEITESPELDPSTYRETQYREDVSQYYRPLYMERTASG